MRKWTVLASAALGLAGLAALPAWRGPRLPPDAERTIARYRLLGGETNLVKELLAGLGAQPCGSSSR